MAFALWSNPWDGWERCTLGPVAGGHRLHGTVHLGQGRVPGPISYELTVADDWAVQNVDVQHDGRTLSLSQSGGRWVDQGGTVLDALDGCLDVDLGFSPAALAPQLRRLALPPSGEVAVDVVVIALHHLEPRRGSLRVTHRSRHHWALRRDGHEAEIHLADAGLVVEHDGGWTALAVG